MHCVAAEGARTAQGPTSPDRTGKVTPPARSNRYGSYRVKPFVLYDSESWPLRKEEERIWQVVEIRMLRVFFTLLYGTRGDWKRMLAN